MPLIVGDAGDAGDGHDLVRGHHVIKEGRNAPALRQPSADDRGGIQSDVAHRAAGHVLQQLRRQAIGAVAIAALLPDASDGDGIQRGGVDAGVADEVVDGLAEKADELLRPFQSAQKRGVVLGFRLLHHAVIFAEGDLG